MPGDSKFDNPTTNPLSILNILIEIFSRADAKWGKSLNDYKFGTFIGRFPYDGAESMAMKGLTRNEMFGIFRAFRGCVKVSDFCGSLHVPFVHTTAKPDT